MNFGTGYNKPESNFDSKINYFQVDIRDKCD